MCLKNFYTPAGLFSLQHSHSNSGSGKQNCRIRGQCSVVWMSTRLHVSCGLASSILANSTAGVHSACLTQPCTQQHCPQLLIVPSSHFRQQMTCNLVCNFTTKRRKYLQFTLFFFFQLRHLIECLVDSGKTAEAAIYAKAAEEFIKLHVPQLYRKLFLKQVRVRLLKQNILKSLIFLCSNAWKL